MIENPVLDFVYGQALRKCDAYEYPEREIKLFTNLALTTNDDDAAERLSNIIKYWDSTEKTIGYQSWVLKQSIKNLFKDMVRSICGK